LWLQNTPQPALKYKGGGEFDGAVLRTVSALKFE